MANIIEKRVPIFPILSLSVSLFAPAFCPWFLPTKNYKISKESHSHIAHKYTD